MSTPQSELSRLANSIEYLTNMFEEDRDGKNIVDAIHTIHLEISDLMSSQQRLENQMHLIIKLLGKDGCC
jgi:hypothetical protein